MLVQGKERRTVPEEPVRGGQPHRGPSGMLHEVRCVQQQGRGAVFATGTPLCNSISDATPCSSICSTTRCLKITWTASTTGSRLLPNHGTEQTTAWMYKSIMPPNKTGACQCRGDNGKCLFCSLLKSHRKRCPLPCS